MVGKLCTVAQLRLYKHWSWAYCLNVNLSKSPSSSLDESMWHCLNTVRNHPIWCPERNDSTISTSPCFFFQCCDISRKMTKLFLSSPIKASLGFFVSIGLHQWSVSSTTETQIVPPKSAGFVVAHGEEGLVKAEKTCLHCERNKSILQKFRELWNSTTKSLDLFMVYICIGGV